MCLEVRYHLIVNLIDKDLMLNAFKAIEVVDQMVCQ